jgi:hypothetical protein
MHGPHDHALEHAAVHADRDALAGRIAVLTAILATLAAMCAYVAGATQSAAGLLKNDAAMRKTEAANQWAYFQAKSTKQSIAEVALLDASRESRRLLEAEIARYREEKAGIESRARTVEQQVLDLDRKSAEQMHAHHRWAQATTALQVAIAMAAIALITRRRWLHIVVYLFATTGLVLAGLAILHI